MNSALRRLLVPLLRSVQAGKVPGFRMKSAAQQALFMVQRKPSPSRKKPARERKEVKRALHREETGAIREAVFQRAEGRCEQCGAWHRLLDLDHWLSGVGRRRQQQSVETCWALCRDCHLARTENRPGIAFWNAAFRAHCGLHGYPFTPHIEHQPIAREPAAGPSPLASEPASVRKESR